MSDNLFYLLFAGIPGIFVTILGIQLFRNKWLRLIAGNTFGDAPKSETDRLHKPLGIFCIIFGLFLIVIGVAGWLAAI
ncbi:MAG: hypothetical protein LKF36_02100 [Lactobacillus sp.]|nr:hypothetical protein [Lactobacillus sp.]